ncbi:MAG: hypothetical protein F2677_05410 [Actinobacteria bacterium]|nr:hypothetical protein [Actinomycetota bacterium]MSZ69296.1 hypothetical protein [Actinomycetota bacterium]
MATTASLVLGADGSSTKNGSSQPLSSAADRERFLRRRRDFDCLIIGGQTANSERYLQTPSPLVILSRSRPSLLEKNAQAHWWQMAPADAIARAEKEFGENIGIEAGPSIILELLALGKIDDFELSITPITGGEGLLDIQNLLKNFQEITEELVDGTQFFSCSGPIIKKQK